MKRLLFILLFLPLLSTGQTTFIVNSYQVQAAGVSYDADAQTYFNALTTAGVTPTSQQMTDINTYVLAAKSHSWWTGRKAIYFPVWSNASANAINLRNPGTYDLTFTGSPTAGSDGVAWNGSSQYANTGMLSNAMGQNSVSLSYYSQTASATTGLYEMGHFATPAMLFQLRAASTTRFGYMNNSTGSSITAAAATNGFFTFSRVNSTQIKLYKNGAQEGSTATQNSSAPNGTQSIILGAAHGNTGTIFGYSIRKMSYSDIGDGLSDSEEANHNTDVEALHDAFSIGQQ